MAKDDWLREYLESIKSQGASTHQEVLDLGKKLDDHCQSQVLTNRDIEARLVKAEEKVKQHGKLVKGAWGLISGLIVSILTWVGTLLYNLFLKGDAK